MKTVTPKAVKKQTIKKAVKKVPSKPAKKLSKSDPGYYAEIGRRSAEARKLKPGYFSDMAKRSHPSNNPDAARDGYHGGRKKKDSENG